MAKLLDSSSYTGNIVLMNHPGKCISASVLAISLFLTITFNVVSAFAEVEEEKKTESRWSGEGELGYARTTGNTDTMSLNTVLGIGFKHKKWEHRFRAEAFFLENSGQTSSERYAVLLLNNYSLTRRSYVFLRASFEDDRFSGYDYMTSEAAGYGIRMINTDTVYLEFSGGPGARQSRSVNGDDENETILFLNSNFTWKPSGTATFKQEVSVETGTNNTRTSSVTGLMTEIAGDLAMKLSYALKNDSQPVEGSENTDTKLTATLVYSF